jgi:Na+-driven multidrug efflux pump
MSEKQETDNVRISQVLAGALAAVTAALLGSTMGVAGTVVGAALASVVSTVGGALYLRSIKRPARRWWSSRTIRPLTSLSSRPPRTARRSSGGACGGR